MFTRLKPSRILLFLGLSAVATGVLGSSTSTHAQQSFAILHSFTASQEDGGNPNAGLIQGPDGTLYGTTDGGGSGLRGTVFRVAPDGTGFTLLHSFTGGPTDGAHPMPV